MAFLYQRSPQQGTEIRPSEIPYNPSGDGNADPNLVVATGTPTPPPTSSSIIPSTSSTVLAASSTPPTRPSQDGLSPGHLAAIIVPIVAVVLLIPLIFLLYRSHQFRKSTEKRQSQRSTEVLLGKNLQRQSSISKGGPTSQAAAFKQLEAGATQTASQSPKKAPRNSFGLFNFGISPPRTPSVSSPPSLRSPGRLSVAHLMPVKRSQVSVVDSNRQTQQSQPSMLLPDVGLASPAHTHFPPLSQFGVAHTGNDSRPTLDRNISSQSTTKNPGRSANLQRPTDAYEIPPRRSSMDGVLPTIPHGGLDWGDKSFPISSNYLRSERQTPVSAYTESGRQTLVSEIGTAGDRLPRPDYHIHRHSDVSSLSDSDGGEDYKRAWRQSDIVSPVHDNGVMQPFRII